MHAGKLESSKRLQDTLACLEGGKWRSTLELAIATGSCAMHSDVAALRANGLIIERRTMPGKGNEHRHQYRLAQDRPGGL